MKRFIAFVLVIIIIIAYHTYLIAIITPYISYSPCDTPLGYHIGSIDSRFNITKNEFASDITEATNIWSKAENKNLFVYSNSQNAITVNFVYDQRQYLNTQITQINNQLHTEQTNIDPKINQYNSESQAFHQQASALNQQIAYWNSKGGAPPDTYNTLIQQQNALQAEANRLNEMASELNQSTGDYNLQIKQLNQTENTYNQVIKARPEEGLWNPKANTITIYFNITHIELVHTLAHEFGHSLGMEHVPDQLAIMYFQTNDRITPTSDDLNQLHTVCKKVTIFELWIEKVNYIIASLQQIK